MSIKKPSKDSAEAGLISPEAIAIVEELLGLIEDSNETGELKKVLQSALTEIFSTYNDIPTEDIWRMALRVADKQIYFWLATFDGHKKLKMAGLLENLIARLQGTETQIPLKPKSSTLFPDENFEGGRSGNISNASFADLDKLNDRTPTLAVKAMNWLKLSKDERMKTVWQLYSMQINGILENFALIDSTGKENIRVDGYLVLCEKLLEELAELDYSELVSADIVATVMVEVVRQHFGMRTGFCMNNNNSDDTIN